MMIKALPRTPELTLEDKLTHLTDTLYRMGLDSKPPKKPFKPFIMPPHRRFRESFDKGRSGKGGQVLVSLDNLIEETDLLVIEEDLDLDDLLKNLTKVLTTRGPEYQERLLAKTE